jgi:uncharacterized membrane protein YqhA
MIQIILLVFSFVLFVISAWQYVAPYWNRIVSLAAAAYVLSVLVHILLTTGARTP